MPERALSLEELNRATLARQGLLEPITAPTTAAAVERIGSLQAQHPDWPPIAHRVRVAKASVDDVPSALRERSLVRASLMRTTIHVVSAADYWAMDAVCRPLLRDQWRLIFKTPPADAALMRRLEAGHSALAAAMRERPRTHDEGEQILAAALPRLAARHPRYWLWRHFAAIVPLVHVPHDEERYGRSRYALAGDWLGSRPEADQESALTAVARRYLAAFGPASVDDFASYVGRRGSTRDRRAAIDRIGDELVRFRDPDGGTIFDLADAPRPDGNVPAPPRLLARWDSLLLSHAPRRRTRVLPEAHRPTVITTNGDVLPTILLDGIVAGTWRLDLTPAAARITMRPFEVIGRSQRRALGAIAEDLLSDLAAGATDRTVVFDG